MSSPARHGAALITALVILMALMLIGIPFLISQRESLAGSYAFKARQESDIGRDSALALGLGLAGEANAHNLSDGDSVHSWLLEDINATFASRPGLMVTEQELDDDGAVQQSRDMLEHAPIDIAILGLGELNRISDPEGSNPPRRRQRTFLGLTIEDHGGKLDVNHLDAAAWHRLLAAAGVVDWDDDQALDSEDRDGYNPGDPEEDPRANRDGNDGNPYGELAEALSLLRFALPEGRITRLEQLLLADPGFNTELNPYVGSPGASYQYYGTAADGYPWGYDDRRYPFLQPGWSTPNHHYDDHKERNWWDRLPPNDRTSGFGFRHPLTRVELERLRPHLTLHGMAQGRGGIIDLGTVIAKRGSQPVLDSAVHSELIREGTVIAAGYDAVSGRHQHLFRSGSSIHSRFDGSFWASWDANEVGYGAQDLAGPGSLDVDQAVAIEAAPTLNLHLLSPVVRATTIGGPPPALSDDAGDLSAIDQFRMLIAQAGGATLGPATAPWQLTDPLASGTESHAIGLQSRGIVSVIAAAAATDPRERVITDAARRVTAQALPAEQALVAQWDSQFKLETLVRARHGSHMASWPWAFTRFGNELPDTAALKITGGDRRPNEEASVLDPDTGLRAQPLSSLAGADHAGLAQAFTRTWRGPANNFLRRRINSSDGVAPEADYHPNDLTPDGLEIDPQRNLRYSMDDGDNRYLLRGNHGSSQNNPIQSGHISLWVKPLDDWNRLGSEPIALLDARMPADRLGLPLRGHDADTVLPAADPEHPWSGFDPRLTGGDADDDSGRITAWQRQATSLQNHWSLHYEGGHRDDAGDPAGHLVLRIVNAAIAHPLDYGPPVPRDDATEPWIDQRCLPGTSDDLPLAPARPLFTSDGRLRRGAVVEHRYQVTMQPDDWYHIRVVMAHDRPGGHAIIVNNVVGENVLLRDADNNPANIALREVGDHLTLPAMVLGQDLEERAIGSDGSPDAPIDIRVHAILPDDEADDDLPGLHALLPQRGMIRIGDEYLSYDGIDPQGEMLLHCRRGQRQDTYVKAGANESEMAWRWPALPAHQSGSRVYPGGLSLHGPGSTLRRGGALLATESLRGDPDFHSLTWGVLRYSNVEDSASGLSNDILPPGDPDGVLEFIHDAVRVRMDESATPEDWPLRGFVRITRKSHWQSHWSFSSGSSSGGINYLFGDLYFYYDNSEGNEPPSPGENGTPFHNIVWLFNEPNHNFQWEQDTTHEHYNPPILILVSMELATPSDLNPRDPDVYASGFQDTPTQSRHLTSRQIMLYDARPGTATYGQLEWLTYHSIFPTPTSGTTGVGSDFAPNNGAGPFYLINYTGFRHDPYVPQDHPDPEARTAYARRHRGIERTPGPDVLAPFPAGTRVLPVQMSGASGTFKTLATGDVVTVVPRDSTSAFTSTTTGGTQVTSHGSLQLAIRYAAADGLYATTGDAGNHHDFDPESDTHNHFFAFTEALPEAIDLSHADLLIWPGWNGEDIGNFPTSSGSYSYAGRSVGNQADRWSLMPFANWFADGLGSDAASARLAIGGIDTRPSRHLADVPQNSARMIVDDLMAARILPNSGNNSRLAERRGRVLAIRRLDGALLDSQELPPGQGLDDNDNTWLEVEAGTGLIERHLINNQGQRGILKIGNEVIAYDRPYIEGRADTAHLRIIGRHLLGSTPGNTLRPDDHVLRLPLGPVVRLGQDLGPGYQGEVTIELLRWAAAGDEDREVEGWNGNDNSPFPLPNTLPPAFVATRPDGSAYEALTLIRYDNRVYTAPWLRGLYNTTVADWQAHDLLIGFWPRYASGYGKDTTITAEHLRSRSYAWAAAALRHYDCSFDSSAIPDGSPVAEISADDISGLALYATGLAGGGFGWEVNDTNDNLIDGIGSPVEWSGSPFDWQWALPVTDPRYRLLHDGGELRIFWRYTSPPLSGVDQDELHQLGRNAGLSPHIRSIILRARAASRILESEPVR